MKTIFSSIFKTNMMTKLKSFFIFKSNLHSYAYLFILAICFIFFQQGDLSHTATSSYAFLRGHYFDFYDYNKLYLTGNDYLPLLYLIYAAWNLPLVLLGFATSPEITPWFASLPIEIIWWKLLLVIFFVSTSKVISMLDSVKKSRESISALIFTTSPIAIFAVFIFSQYDVISVFFTMLGIYFFLKKDLIKFSWLFSIAISFKYFAIVAFIPLLLIAEKRPLHILKLLAIAIAVTLVQIILFWHSDAFRNEIFQLTSAKIDVSLRSKGMVILSGLIYSVFCMYLYTKDFSNFSKLRFAAIFCPIFAYALMFLVIPWHPQWLIILTPFFAMSFGYIKNKKFFLFFEILGMLSFIWFVVNNWPGNVDVGMVSRGAMKNILPNPTLMISDLLVPRFAELFFWFFNLYLFSPLILVLFNFKVKLTKFTSNANNSWLFSRFFLGISFFLIPSLFCIFLPLEDAFKINPSAFLRTQKEFVVSAVSDEPVGVLFADNAAEQTFIPLSDGLSGVSIKLATYARKNQGLLRLEIFEGNSKIHSEFVEMGKITDNSFRYFRFPTRKNSKGKIFKIKLSTDSMNPANGITAWKSSTDTYAAGQLNYKSVRQAGDLVFNLYFDPNISLEPK